MPPHGPRASTKPVPTGPNAVNYNGTGSGGRNNRSFGGGNHAPSSRSSLSNPRPQNKSHGPNSNSNGSRSQSQPQHQNAHTHTPEPDVQTVIGDVESFKGPIPDRNVVPTQYLLQQHVQKQAREAADRAHNEETLKIQGIQVIDKVRLALQLPVRTFDTAACYFHRSRLTSPEHNYHDVALAALFVACKVEDTMKKSRDILCAAHNLKSPDHPITPDDKSLERPSMNIISLERTILETVGFNFRVRHPQKHLAKVCHSLGLGDPSQEFYVTAYHMLMDMYKTLVPIKQGTYVMVLATLELTTLVTGQYITNIKEANLSRFRTRRADVVETMLDMLDLYTQHHKMTLLGAEFGLDQFLAIKIQINEEVDANPELDRYASRCSVCDKDTNLATAALFAATSPPLSGPRNSTGNTGEGTIRFLFSAENSKLEEAEVDKYTRDEYDEYEEEVEEPIAEFNDGGSGGGGGGNRAPGGGGGGGRRNRDRQRHGHGHGHGPPSGPPGQDPYWHPYPKDRGRRGRKMH
ncbi:CTD kinase subunit beta [Ceratocystis fimbriata CBS 114723]|uniref:RNA polymerase II holoenzyme cyclin-like subunit n=1 Tax=Ceratocystis fimbriata CBS 114723 TaxID=1035309 RepID=A0A2C5WUK7_9PEZI|nr:CTD kinase subunit beta [Ceratocystis fimbriata CBS 114723]